jgi:hypothetical protein
VLLSQLRQHRSVDQADVRNYKVHRDFFQHCDRLEYIRRFEYLKPLAPKICRLEHSFEDVVCHDEDNRWWTVRRVFGH